MSLKTALYEVSPYITRDGSEIRELLHQHRTSEEIYHVTQGNGLMTLGGETFAIAVGDSIAITPGMPHRVENTGTGALHILCCCAPAYAHADTELL